MRVARMPTGLAPFVGIIPKQSLNTVASRWIRGWRWILGALLFCASFMAQACAICAPADAYNTLVSRLTNADAVVIARPTTLGDVFEVAVPVKGAAGVSRIAVTKWHPGPPLKPGASVLLLFNAQGKQWTGWGNLPVERAAWLTRILSMPPAAMLDWPTRLAFFVSDFEDAEPLVAQAAYDEVAGAPYSAMRLAKDRLRPELLARWVRDPLLQSRRPLYTLLLGISGTPAHAAELESALGNFGANTSMGVVSATLAALVEIRGLTAVQQIESGFFANAQRSESDVQAAVLALSVHGNDGVRVSRDRVVAALATLVQKHPAMAGLAASDLAAWGHWELGSQFSEILRSGRPLSFASRYAMVFFLLRSPRPQDRKAVAELRAAGSL